MVFTSGLEEARDSMRLKDIILPIVEKIFGRNQQFAVRHCNDIIYVQNGSGDMRSMSIHLDDGKVINSRGSAKRHGHNMRWSHDIRDPNALDKISARLVKFAQTKAEDLVSDE